MPSLYWNDWLIRHHVLQPRLLQSRAHVLGLGLEIPRFHEVQVRYRNLTLTKDK
jgi:hypothetical protein